ncbi:MAG: histidine phosphatase family protein [Myxococcota bacterium]|jgi:phosphohistidine phosphatase SixA|nr:histidine phosphatase family protein [Myxococcota bacterium]
MFALRVWWVVLVLSFWVGCADDDACPPEPDGGAVALDAGAFDAGSVDAGDERPDAAPRPDAGPPPSGRPTTYYVIRHTERDPGLDPPINAEGQARAERLATLLGATGFDEIVVTSFLRNQQSAAPLAERTGTPVTVAPISMTSSWAEFGSEVAAWQRDREVPGSTVLMIGHSGGYNAALLRGLGAEGVTILERYQDLVIVVREPDGSVRSSVLEYGGPSSLDPTP